MSDITVEEGTQIEFNVTGSHSPADVATDYGIAGATNVVLTQASLPDAAGRQSDKFDFGPNRAKNYSCFASEDFTGEAPTQGERLDYWFLPSTITTQANANVVGNSGADAAAPGGALGGATLADMIAMAEFIGSLIIHDGAAVQNGYVGTFSPSTRFGQLLVVNESGDVLEDDDVENQVVLNALRDDVA